MKKLIIAILSLLFFVTIIDTFLNASQRRRRYSRYSMRYRYPRRRSTRTRGVTKRRRVVPTKKSQVIAKVEQNVKQKTIELEKKMEEVKAAPTPEAKKEALISVQETAQDLTKKINIIERSFKGDIFGYSGQQVNAAKLRKKALEKERAEVETEIKEKEEKLAAMTQKGSIWSLYKATVKEGITQKEFDDLNTEINGLYQKREDIIIKIENNDVIANNVWSNAKMVLGGATAALAATGTVLFGSSAASAALSAGSSIGSLAMSAGSTAVQYAPGAFYTALKVSDVVSNIKWVSMIAGGALTLAQYVYKAKSQDPNADPQEVEMAQETVDGLAQLKALSEHYMALLKDPKADQQKKDQIVQAINALQKRPDIAAMLQQAQQKAKQAQAAKTIVQQKTEQKK